MLMVVDLETCVRCSHPYIYKTGASPLYCGRCEPPIEDYCRCEDCYELLSKKDEAYVLCKSCWQDHELALDELGGI